MGKPRTTVARRKALGVLALATAGGLAAPAAGRAQEAAREALSRGGMELSTAIALSVSKESGASESTTLLNVPVRLGVMVANRLELEGEVLVTHGSFGGDGDTGVVGAAHVLYHFRTGGNTVPYLLAGGGFGTGFEYAGLATNGQDGVAVLRAGAGFKTFFSRRASLRGEYRFTHSSASGRTEAMPNPFYRESIDDHKVLVGVSLWF
jgi:hypothetical protein